ncbi:hypothetical protein HDV03_004061 [Kappamyces sp. JEL0829]|nr:hypothetical protein HDV03_004061 [Kappamyces sp. JEL0829]
MASFSRERAIGIRAVQLASQLCQSVFKQLVHGQTITKSDASPVTVADFGAQALVNSILHKEFPADAIIGEEDSKDLQENDSLCSQVLEITNSVLGTQKLPRQELLDAIDLGKYEGGPKGRFWTLDPIDGTKGFLRGEQYAVCLALIVDGQVQLAVQGCPNLPHNIFDSSSERGSIFVAVRGAGAYERSLSSPLEKKIAVSSVAEPSATSFCESVEAAHSSQGDTEAIAKALGIANAPVRMDSQCKYAVIARGDAGIYLRIPTRPDYQEKIWDHAGGSLLVEEAGGKISDIDGQPLDFSLGRTLRGNRGIIATNVS